MKRVLIISNNPISNNSNNGVTLTNLFKSFHKNEIINFFISDSLPSQFIANSYFRITDNEVIKFGCFKNLGKEINQQCSFARNDTKQHKSSRQKTPSKFLIRDIAWTFSKWKSKKFKRWLKEYNPTSILLFIGDSPFLINISLKIQRCLKIPLFVYNTETYYFKNFNYFDRKNFKMNLPYVLFRKRLVNSYNSLAKNVSAWFHLTDDIANLYKQKFGGQHVVIKNSFSFKNYNYKIVENRFNICYFGNTSLGRFELLCDIADSLQKISNSSKMFIFGNLNRSQLDVLNNKNNMVFKGFADTKYINEFIDQNCDLLLHIETFNDGAKKDLMHSFSTKIPDCLVSGIPFLVCAPNDFFFVQYLKSNKIAFICDKENINEYLLFLYNDVKQRASLVNEAYNFAIKNHSPDSNSTILRSVIFK